MKIHFRTTSGLPMKLMIITSLLHGCVVCPSDQKSLHPGFDLFSRRVKPIFEYYCIECHNNKGASLYGGLSLETRAAAMSSGQHAPVIRPGSPETSLLYTVLRLGHEDVLGMPPAPDKVLADELVAVHRWILSGASWPSGREGNLKLPE